MMLIVHTSYVTIAIAPCIYTYLLSHQLSKQWFLKTSLILNCNKGRYQHLVKKYYGTCIQMKKCGIGNSIFAQSWLLYLYYVLRWSYVLSNIKMMIGAILNKLILYKWQLLCHEDYIYYSNNSRWERSLLKRFWLAYVRGILLTCEKHWKTGREVWSNKTLYSTKVYCKPCTKPPSQERGCAGICVLWISILPLSMIFFCWLLKLFLQFGILPHVKQDCHVLKDLIVFVYIKLLCQVENSTVQ